MWQCSCMCECVWQTTCQHCAELVLVSDRQPASWPAEIKRLSGQCVDLGAVY